MLDVALWQGSATLVTVAEAELQRKATISDARKRAADTMKRRREGRGNITTGNQPRTRVMELHNQWCYIACYIPWYITHTILNAIYHGISHMLY